MDYKAPKFNEKIEKVYLSRFSSRRYKFFQFLEKIYKKFINNKDGRIEFIVDYISQVKPKFILEVGSGVFPIYPFLPLVLRKECEYYICETNKEKVQYLQKQYPHLKIKVANALLLPYQDNCFDLVFSKGVFHHIDDNDSQKRIEKKINFLKESRRVLKKNGTNLLMDFCYTPRRFKDFFWHKLYKIILWESDYNYLNRLEVEKLFRSANYKKIESYEIDTFKGLYYCVIGKK